MLGENVRAPFHFDVLAPPAFKHHQIQIQDGEKTYFGQFKERLCTIAPETMI